MLRVQASDETLEGSGSKDLVSEGTPRGYPFHHWPGAETDHNLLPPSNQTGIRRTISRSEIVVDTSDRIPEIPCFFSAGI